MPNTQEQPSTTTPSEAAIGSVAPFSNLVKEISGFAKTLYVEQRLPAAILIITLISLVVVILASPSEGTRLFLWFATIPLLLMLVFFVLPRQGKQIQEIRKNLQELADENESLKGRQNTLSNKLDQVREQVTNLANDAYGHLENVERSLGNIQSRVNEMVVAQDVSTSQEKAEKINSELAKLSEYINKKKQEVDNIRARVPGAERVLDSAQSAGSFFAQVQRDMEDEDSQNDEPQAEQ